MDKTSVYRAVADFSQARRETASFQRDLSSLDKAFATMGRNDAAPRQAQSTIKGIGVASRVASSEATAFATAEQEVARASSVANTAIGGQITQVFQFAKALGLARVAGGSIAAVIASVTSGAVMMGIGFNAAREQSITAFTSILRDSKAAEDMFKRVQTLAAFTPFETGPLQKLTQQLLGFGLSSEKVLSGSGRAIKGLVNDVATASAAMGGDINFKLEVIGRSIGQIYAKGRLQGEEAMQLAEAGIPVYRILEEQLGLTKAQLGDLGRQGIDADKAISALQAGIRSLYGDALVKQSQTATGQVSTFTDNIKIMLGNATLELFNTYKKVFNALNLEVEKFSKSVQKNGLAGALKAELPAISGVVGGVIRTFNALRDVVMELRPAAETFLKAFSGAALITLGVALQAVGVALQAIAAVVRQIPEPVLKVIGLVAGLRAAFAVLSAYNPFTKLISMIVAYRTQLIEQAVAANDVAIAEAGHTAAVEMTAIAQLNLNNVMTAGVADSELLAAAQVQLTTATEAEYVALTDLRAAQAAAATGARALGAAQAILMVGIGAGLLVWQTWTSTINTANEAIDAQTAKLKAANPDTTSLEGQRKYALALTGQAQAAARSADAHRSLGEKVKGVFQVLTPGTKNVVVEAHEKSIRAAETSIEAQDRYLKMLKTVTRASELFGISQAEVQAKAKDLQLDLSDTDATITSLGESLREGATAAHKLTDAYKLSGDAAEALSDRVKVTATALGTFVDAAKAYQEATADATKKANDKLEEARQKEEDTRQKEEESSKSAKEDAKRNLEEQLRAEHEAANVSIGRMRARHAEELRQLEDAGQASQANVSRLKSRQVAEEQAADRELAVINNREKALKDSTEADKKRTDGTKQNQQDVVISLQQFGEALQKQIADANAFTSNLDKIAGSGQYKDIAQPLVDTLLGMGDKGKDLAKQLADDQTGAGRKVAELIVEQQRIAGEAYAKELTTRWGVLTQANRTEATKSADAIAQALGLSPDQVVKIIETYGNAGMKASQEFNRTFLEQQQKGREAAEALNADRAAADSGDKTRIPTRDLPKAPAGSPTSTAVPAADAGIPFQFQKVLSPQEYAQRGSIPGGLKPPDGYTWKYSTRYRAFFLVRASIDVNQPPTYASASGKGRFTQADGGILIPATVRAAEGLQRMSPLPSQAQVRPPGSVVQWAEPETGGEAFIPLSPAKRRRSLDIWRTVGEHFGVLEQAASRATWADGGLASGGAAAFGLAGLVRAPSGPVVHPVTVRVAADGLVTSQSTTHRYEVGSATIVASDPQDFWRKTEAHARLTALGGVS